MERWKEEKERQTDNNNNNNNNNNINNKNILRHVVMRAQHKKTKEKQYHTWSRKAVGWQVIP